MRQKASVAAVTLMLGVVLAALVSVVAMGLPILWDSGNVEASAEELRLPDAVERGVPQTDVANLEATKAYVNEAVRRYREDPEAAIAYYQTRESFSDDGLRLYLLLLDGDEIILNGVFAFAAGSPLSWRHDPTGNRYGEKLVAADENGVVVEYLIPVPSQDYTFRKKTAWAVRAEGLVFSSGWIDREEDVESQFIDEHKAIGATIEARARTLTDPVKAAVDYYNSPDRMQDEPNFWMMAYPSGEIAAHLAMPDVVGTNIKNLPLIDGFDLGAKILEVDGQFETRWISPETGASRHYYVNRYYGYYIVSSYYGEPPKTDFPEPRFSHKVAAKNYVIEAITRYGRDAAAAEAYYMSLESLILGQDEDEKERLLYLIVINAQNNLITLNGAYHGMRGMDITGRIGKDAVGKDYGSELVTADENGVFVEYFYPYPLTDDNMIGGRTQDKDYTVRKVISWAIRNGDEIFVAGTYDLEEDVESTFEPYQWAIATANKGGLRMFVDNIGEVLGYLNSPAAINGEYYAFVIAAIGPGGTIVPGVDGMVIVDPVRPDLIGTSVRDLQATDDPNLGDKIADLEEGEERWFSYLWLNPATGREELKHTYVSKLAGLTVGSGYYGGAPPPMPPAPCVTPIDGAGTYTGTWDDSCLSENRPGGEDGEEGKDYYTRFYTFTLEQAMGVTISLSSAKDTYLYLLEGAGEAGAITAFNDDISDDDRNSRIALRKLDAGTYTIEATTYKTTTAGDFTLVVEIEDVEPPPPTVTYTDMSGGAKHVCGIATDGSIMCWGDDSYGQVSERPTSGSFTKLISGDTYNCALRDDGIIVCWGSIELP